MQEEHRANRAWRFTLARQRSRTVQDLLLAGCAALGVWTVWANGPIGLVVGNPLEQAQLIRQLFAYIFNTDLSSVKANILHCVVGAIIYPLGYWLLLSSRWYRPPFDGWLWGLATFAFPMGAFALSSERPFLLVDNNARLSLMILIGHVLHGLALSRAIKRCGPRARSLGPGPVMSPHHAPTDGAPHHSKLLPPRTEGPQIMPTTRGFETSRVAWVDYAKGLCIIMVVMMHSTLGVELAAERQGFMHNVVEFARPFRMPDCFLISGLFVSQVIDGRGAFTSIGRSFTSSISTLLWTAIQFVFKPPGIASNHGWRYVGLMYLQSFIEPFGTLWFIYLLPIFFLVTRITRQLPSTLIWIIAAALEMAHIQPAGP